MGDVDGVSSADFALCSSNPCPDEPEYTAGNLSRNTIALPKNISIDKYSHSHTYCSDLYYSN